MRRFMRVSASQLSQARYAAGAGPSRRSRPYEVNVPLYDIPRPAEAPPTAQPNSAPVVVAAAAPNEVSPVAVNGDHPLPPITPPAKKLRGIRKLVEVLGPWLALYYFLFNETCVLFCTVMLHYDFLDTGDIQSVLEYLGVSKYVDVESQLKKSIHIGSLEISGRLAANFALATAFMSLWTPIQIPFCVLTLRHFMRLPQMVQSFGLSRLLSRQPPQ